MEILNLTRLSTSPDGTIGVLTYKLIPICYTLEEPWENNERNISCIPAGSYVCTPERHKRWPASTCIYRVNNVPNRDGILIHPGNTLEDISGCILPGKSFKFQRPLFLEYSSLALEHLIKILAQRQFRLNIKSPEVSLLLD